MYYTCIYIIYIHHYLQLLVAYPALKFRRLAEDALHILALQRAKSFDLHMENCSLARKKNEVPTSW